MQEKPRSAQSTSVRGKSRMPSNSVLFEKIVPVLLILMGVVMVALVLFAAAVLLGFVKF